jgi:NitT/TauT family transport system substrate-binding protein
MDEAGKPKPLFWIALFGIVGGLIAFALMRADILFPKAKSNGAMPNISKEDLDKAKGNGVEAPDANVPTTVKEYKFVAAEKLPPVQGVSNYKLTDNTVKLALNVWAGWAPVIYANDGFAAKKVWKAADGSEFKLDLVLIDDPVAMRDAYASGSVQIGWATVDMLPLFLDDLKRDSRTMPRVFQQIDWSNGGDGIVARDGITSIGQLRGKTVVLSQNSPSQYFVLNALINGGIQPAEVKFMYTGDAFQAAAAFNADKKISACVSWSPDIYNLSKLKGNKLIVSTGDANRLIADVWFSRADFAKDHPAIVESLVRGFLDATEELDNQENKQKAAKLMADGYKLPPADALAMLGDAHWTNYAENREFFLNQNNPTNFERTWDTAYYIYNSIHKAGDKISWDKIADFSIIQKLGSEEKYAKSVNKYQVNFAPKSVSSIQAESGEILTKTVVIHFFPNSADIHKKISRTDNGKNIEELYDPNVDFVLEEIGKMTGQYGASRIVIEGHTDGSMRGNVPVAAVMELSGTRAESVRKALLEKFKSINPNQIGATGKGWDVPADPQDPNNHAKNRRVEVKVYPLEQQN